MSKTSVENEIEKFRQVVIAASTSADVGPDADACVVRLNALFEKDRTLFTPEDVRFVNSMWGIYKQRMAKYSAKGGPFAAKGKRRGDVLTQCWRCETTVDSRFVDICPECSDPKVYKWRICPVCKACGCQRANKTLV